MICPPCANTADASTRLLGGHSPSICRDAGLPHGGCVCQHKPVGSGVLTPLPPVITINSNGERA